MKNNLTLRRIFSIAGVVTIVGGAIYALYGAASYIIGPGNGDEFLLASVFSLVFVFAGSSAYRKKKAYTILTR